MRTAGKPKVRSDFDRLPAYDVEMIKTAEKLKHPAVLDAAAPESRSNAADTGAFQLSRIYSQGWNAARKLAANGAPDPGEKQAAKLNPHRGDVERERWAKGFAEALQGRAGQFNTCGGSSWRPAI
jgi:hypothetical protein